MFAERQTPARGHPYRRPGVPTPRAAGVAAADAGRSRALRVLALGLLGLSGWSAAIGWREHRLSAAVAAMPRAVQQAAYRRAHDELSTTCATQPQLDEHCRAEAELILHFPQCKADCDALARPFLADARR